MLIRKNVRISPVHEDWMKKVVEQKGVTEQSLMYMAIDEFMHREIAKDKEVMEFLYIDGKKERNEVE